MRILVKVGGAALEESGPRLRFAECVFAATRVGHEVIVVHGGGNQIARLCERRPGGTAGIAVASSSHARAVGVAINSVVERLTALGHVKFNDPIL